MLRDLTTGKVRALTAGWDRSVGSIAWSPDSKRILVTAEDTQENPIWSVDRQRQGRATDRRRQRLGRRADRKGRGVRDEQPARARRFLPADRQEGDAADRGQCREASPVSTCRPSPASTSPRQHDTVWGYAVKPYGSTGKVPIAFMVHGGPQGTSNNSWSYRWKPGVVRRRRLRAGSNRFHGSTGYGQAFSDAIRNNWGGWPLEDLQKGLKAATSKFDWLDADNACALGASYGGYMMNWIEGPVGRSLQVHRPA